MGPTVYYVDDEPQLTRHFRAYMERRGFSVRVFRDAAATIEACRKDPPRVLFIDYRLEETTGDKVADAVAHEIKKVLVTGDLNTHTDDRFCAVLNKPFKLEKALELVNDLLGDR